jgi:hypothetical protein
VNGFSAAIAGAGRAIGNYFSIVSFIPSLFLTGLIFAFIEAGAWSAQGKLDWVRAGNALTNVGHLALLALVSMALGIALHPLQFALVQFFEGYWGNSRLAQRARVAKILRYQDRYRSLRFGPGRKAAIMIDEADACKHELNPRFRTSLLSIRDESERAEENFPDEADDIMPTRLGNVLRRYERLAGSQYGLDAVKFTRHIALVAQSERVDYLNDQRQLLDLSVRMCATSFLATLVTVAALWRQGPWLSMALIPYAVAYLCYRGSVVVAHEYGAAIGTLIDLDRFRLYESLRLPLPKNTRAERKMNSRLNELLDYNEVVLSYEHPPVPDSTKENLT